MMRSASRSDRTSIGSSVVEDPEPLRELRGSERLRFGGEREVDDVAHGVLKVQVQRSLRVTERLLWLRREAVGERTRLGQPLVRGHDTVRESERERGRRVDPVPREQEL